MSNGIVGIGNTTVRDETNVFGIKIKAEREGGMRDSMPEA